MQSLRRKLKEPKRKQPKPEEPKRKSQHKKMLGQKVEVIRGFQNRRESTRKPAKRFECEDANQQDIQEQREYS